MTDSEEDIKRKINKAYCPEAEVEENPILEYFKYLIFEKNDKVTVERDEKFGGTVEYESYEELENDYVGKKLHPVDLKNAAAKYLDEALQPVRRHFEANPYARALLDQVKSFHITR